MCTSVFNQRIINKEHIIIIIEDTNGNKFGGYVNVKIDKIDNWINDPKSFLFSIETKRRIQRMKKFDIKYLEDAFWLYDQSSNYLFTFGCDIYVYKESYKTKSYCKQRSYEYKGITNALC
ncbi:hypothetical protein KM1_032450 [Entamoeba histolytica HM-3:IMSS]|uniref:TLDc domain-containing protein n=1 Tax=Entamoeba histolytica HM-3:IMSS TaxID=885315 RepID=M7WCK6_ENTHI|nr:hypothetical protein KM1_032450 [Entamoeba histolytica HM-3:IMSS]